MNTPIDMTQFTQPKSDQINADDLIGGPRTITITGVSANASSAEQPVNIRFQGDDGKPYRPCKSMRRVMIAAWGPDASQYVGRSMTLFRDPTVTWGGMQVGGIRISHMTHIAEPMTIALTATRSSRKPYRIQPLEAPKSEPLSSEDMLLIDGIEACVTTVDLEKWKAANGEAVNNSLNKRAIVAKFNEALDAAHANANATTFAGG